MPLHSDLHDENILDDDEVPGFIDFGEALVGPAAWEFAALAYFLDWPTADAILAAYLDDEHPVRFMVPGCCGESVSLRCLSLGTGPGAGSRRGCPRRGVPGGDPVPDVTAKRGHPRLGQRDPSLDDRHHGTRDPHLDGSAVGVEVSGRRQA